MRASWFLRMALSEIPMPPGSSSLDRAESVAKETRFRSCISESTLLFTSSIVRLRLRSYTSLSQDRSLTGRLDLDLDFTLFILLVSVDFIHLREFVVAVPHQLFHPLDLREQPFLGGVIHLEQRPLLVLLNLVSLGRIW